MATSDLREMLARVRVAASETVEHLADGHAPHTAVAKAIVKGRAKNMTKGEGRAAKKAEERQREWSRAAGEFHSLESTVATLERKLKDLRAEIKKTKRAAGAAKRKTLRLGGKIPRRPF